MVNALVLLLAGTLCFPGAKEKPKSFDLKKENRWFLCHFGPEIKLVAEDFQSESSCEGNLKIQIVKWHCGKPSDVLPLTQSYFDLIKERGRSACLDYCAKRGTSCFGDFRPPKQCAFSVPPSQALTLGDQVGCHGGCVGKAFVYCSLYHAGFSGISAEMVQDQPPNCVCRKRYTP